MLFTTAALISGKNGDHAADAAILAVETLRPILEAVADGSCPNRDGGDHDLETSDEPTVEN